MDCYPGEGLLLPHREQSLPPGDSSLQHYTEATCSNGPTRSHPRCTPAGLAQRTGCTRQQGGERFAGWEMVLKVTIVMENVLYSYIMKSNLTLFSDNALTSALASSRIGTAAVLYSAAMWRAVTWVENVICDGECTYHIIFRSHEIQVRE